jgi:NAD dependent epimerase/dehydratase family enzyme
LRLAFGQMGDELLLVSQQVRPARLESLGFSFSFPTLEAALRHEFGRHGGHFESAPLTAQRQHEMVTA